MEVIQHTVSPPPARHQRWRIIAVVIIVTAVLIGLGLQAWPRTTKKAAVPPTSPAVGNSFAHQILTQQGLTLQVASYRNQNSSVDTGQANNDVTYVAVTIKLTNTMSQPQNYDAAYFSLQADSAPASSPLNNPKLLPGTYKLLGSGSLNSGQSLEGQLVFKVAPTYQQLLLGWAPKGQAPQFLRLR